MGKRIVLKGADFSSVAINDNDKAYIRFKGTYLSNPANWPANWDTNNDGILFKSEAAQITSIDGAFTGNTQLDSFDEFKYFTGVSFITIYSGFNGCTNLKSIIIPGSCKNIADNTFSGCTSLKRIVFNEGIENIGGFCMGRGPVEEVTLPSTIKTIGNAAFTYIPMSGGTTKATILATNPPTLGDSKNAFQGFTEIFVPANSVDAYKSSDSWTPYINIIKAIQ